MTIQKVYGDNPNSITLKGRWTVMVHRGEDLIQKVEGNNVILTNGKEFLASFLYSAAVAASTFTCRYVSIGTDATAEAAANTALGTELARVSGVVSYVSNQIFQVTGTFPSGTGTGAIVEYGLSSTLTAGGGTMLSRDTESVVTKGANDVLTAILRVTIS